MSELQAENQLFTSKESRQKLIMGKDDPEEQTRQINLMAAGSKVKVNDANDVPKEEPIPVIDLSKAALEKHVGKVFEKRNGGIYGPARYKVLHLVWSETKPRFQIERDSPLSPLTEYEDMCENFLKHHKLWKPHVPEVKAEVKVKKPKTPWSDNANATSGQ